MQPFDAAFGLAHGRPFSIASNALSKRRAPKGLLSNRLAIPSDFDAAFGLAHGRPFSIASNALSKRRAPKGGLDHPKLGQPESRRGLNNCSTWAMPFFPSIDCPPRSGSLVWVYILETTDGTFYVGQSNDVGERLRKHRFGLGSKHTADHKGARLVYVDGPLPRLEGIARERQLKRWSRAKKEALIRGDAVALRALSRSHD